jgi:hypothetical protein
MVEQIPSIPSALRHQPLASPAIPAPTTASADFRLQLALSPFQEQGETFSGKNAFLPCTTAVSTPLRLDHKSFSISCPIALLGSVLERGGSGLTFRHDFSHSEASSAVDCASAAPVDSGLVQLLHSLSIGRKFHRAHHHHASSGVIPAPGIVSLRTMAEPVSECQT